MFSCINVLSFHTAGASPSQHMSCPMPTFHLSSVSSSVTPVKSILKPCRSWHGQNPQNGIWTEFTWLINWRIFLCCLHRVNGPHRVNGLAGKTNANMNTAEHFRKQVWKEQKFYLVKRVEKHRKGLERKPSSLAAHGGGWQTNGGIFQAGGHSQQSTVYVLPAWSSEQTRRDHLRWNWKRE